MMTPLRTLYIVDDAADYRLLLQQLFKVFLPTYSVQFYSSGKMFLKALPQLEHLPGLIILDRHMPGLDGHQTLLQLKQHPVYRTTPVIMMSAHASAFEIFDCYRAGANSFILKPSDFDSLKQTMSLVCNYWLELNQKSVEA